MHLKSTTPPAGRPKAAVWRRTGGRIPIVGIAVASARPARVARSRPRTGRLIGLVAVVGLLAASLQPAAPASAFGTITGLGQRAEHERITRAALACPPGVQSTGDCFEPKSIDQLAGHSGTLGAVGAPDGDETFSSAAHCDDADFLDAPGYPRTRADRDLALQACIDHFRTRIQEGVTAATRVLDGNNDLIGKEVDLDSDCTFFGGVSGRAKCDALEGFGRALHGAQDFYSHSNWADERDPGQPIGIRNPPGLNLPAPSPLLNLVVPPGSPIGVPPSDLSTGRFVPGVDETGCAAASFVTRRVTHACLNKDEALIDPATGATSDPRTPRGQVLSNEQKAVAGAIGETRRQWADVRARLIATYGAERGGRIIRALTQDVPKVDFVFAIDTTGSMSPYIAGVVTNANSIVDALSGRGTTQRLSDFRVGLVDYKDVDSVLPFPCPPDYDASVDLTFNGVRANIVAAINTLPGKVGGGCDLPEDVLSGIKRAVDFPWRKGVRKAIIVMGDAPGHDPEAHSGLTSAAVIAAANAVDPASIYPILVGFNASAASFMRNLAAGTGGKAFDSNASNVGQAVLDAINLIVTAPPSGDTTPPAVTVGFPMPPAGQAGFFNAAQIPVLGSVTATDTSNVTAINCSDSAGGLAQGVLAGGGTASASRPLSASGDGTHSILCTATDGAIPANTGAAPGSQNAATLKIDQTPPQCTVTVSPAELWPPNHKLVPITVSVAVTDALSGPAGFTLQSVTSNEPDDALGDGDTPSDVQGFVAGDASTSGQLRAERSGGGTGRVYTLTYRARDAAGNVSSCAATVTVSHDRRS